MGLLHLEYNKDFSMIRPLHAAYRFLLRHIRSNNWEQFRHRLKLAWSFQVNRWALFRHMMQAGVCKENCKVIVISQVVHLGDIAACEPIVRQVRRENPDAFIVFALHYAYRELIDTHPDIDHTLAVACVTEWSWFSVAGIFDRIIDLNIDGRKCEICGIPWHKPEGNHGVTISNYYEIGNLIESYSRSANLGAPSDGPRIYQAEENITLVNRLDLPKRFLVLHTGSNERERELPVHIWKQIIRHVNEIWRLPVVEIGMNKPAISANDVANRSLCGKLSILQSAEVIRRSILYLGTDSGPAHLANAVGAYAVIMFGHYHNFRRYLPYSGDYAQGIRCELLYHNGPLAQMPVEMIKRAIDRRLLTVMSSSRNSYF